jgi:hypothetical protein
VAQWTAHATVWALAPFLAGIVYLVLESLETALGERIALRSGDDEAADLST